MDGISSLSKIVDNEKRLSFTQYLNTVLLTVVGVIAMIIFLSLRDLKQEIVRNSETMIKFQVLQDHNTQQIDDVDARVKILEINNTQDIKNWIDMNYVRKAQK